MSGKFSGVESERTISKFRKRNFVVFSPTSTKRARSCATKAKKRCDAHAKLLFCQSKPISFFAVLVVVTVVVP